MRAGFMMKRTMCRTTLLATTTTITTIITNTDGLLLLSLCCSHSCGRVSLLVLNQPSNNLPHTNYVAVSLLFVVVVVGRSHFLSRRVVRREDTPTGNYQIEKVGIVPSFYRPESEHIFQWPTGLWRCDYKYSMRVEEWNRPLFGWTVTSQPKCIAGYSAVEHDSFGYLEKNGSVGAAHFLFQIKNWLVGWHATDEHLTGSTQCHYTREWVSRLTTYRRLLKTYQERPDRWLLACVEATSNPTCHQPNCALKNKVLCFRSDR